MTNKVIGGSSPNESLGNNQFRLIFHIGAGKTGTTSIQQTLRTQQERLKEQGVWYLGLMLEHAPVHQFVWQKASDGQDFLALESQQAADQALQVLRKAIPVMQTAGCREAIWSNEVFFRRGTASVLAAMRQIAADGIDVRIVAYVRRHDAWARSAYVQWGLKHKTYQGPIQSFDQWIKRRPPEFFKALRPWIDAFGDRVVVRNLDAVGDAVLDFMKIADISPEGLERLRAYGTPTGEELIFRALFNEQFTEKVPVSKFDQLFGATVRFDRSLDSWLSQMMPNQESLDRVSVQCTADRNALNELLLASRQAPIDISPLSEKLAKVDPNKILTSVCQLVVGQAVKIQELERKVKEVEAQPTQASPAATPSVVNQGNSGQAAVNCPVFAISTGRSGSTLVQRVLNCHQDLVVWGEHYGMLNGLANVYVQMANPDQKQYPRKPEDNNGPTLLLPSLKDPAAPLEWVNPWSLEEFKGQLKQFIEGYFASHLADGKRWGFKEIRYNTLPVLRMLRDLYPGGRFIFIRRDPLEVTRSKVFAFIKEAKWSEFTDAEKTKRIRNMLNEVGEHYHVYDMFMQRNPGLGLAVDYEELVAQPREVTARMLAHLGLDPARFDWSLGDQVMASIITKTKRDDEVISQIREIAAQLEQERV